jgi:RNA polymerase sigma-70 factor (ECF subfamily)
MQFLPDDVLAALPRLRRYARLLVNDPALADVLVEATLASARQTQAKAPSGMTPRLRLLCMLHSVYANQFAPGRPSAPQLSLDAEKLNPLGSSDSAAVASESNAQRAQVLLDQLYRLPTEQREVLILAAVERLSYEDIATLLAVPVATVLARLTRARESLRTGAFDTLMAPKNTG